MDIRITLRKRRTYILPASRTSPVYRAGGGPDASEAGGAFLLPVAALPLALFSGRSHSVKREVPESAYFTISFFPPAIDFSPSAGGGPDSTTRCAARLYEISENLVSFSFLQGARSTAVKLHPTRQRMDLR
jgi:hypothetical protein